MTRKNPDNSPQRQGRRQQPDLFAEPQAEQGGQADSFRARIAGEGPPGPANDPKGDKLARHLWPTPRGR